MKRIIISIVALASATSWAGAPKLSSSVRTTVRDSLPGAPPTQAQGISYPVPGNAYLSAVQFCGDGDVANFAAGHPDWQHQESGNVSFAVGYWLQQQGGSDLDYPSPAPALGNYFAAGTGTLVIGGATVTNMTPANVSDQAAFPTGVSILGNLNSTLGTALGMQSYSMPAAAGSSSEAFSLFFGIMVCKSLPPPASPSPVVHDPLKVSSAIANFAMGSTLSNSVAGTLSTALNQASPPSFNSLTLQASIANGTGAGASGIVVQANGSGSIIGSIGTDALTTMAQALYQLAPPTATDQAGWSSALTAALQSANISALASDLQSKATCNTVSGVSQSGRFGWEPYPLQLTCGALNSYGGQTLQALIATFVAQAPTVHAQAFNLTKVPLLTALVSGAIIQNLQASFAASADPLPRQSCISASPYINSVMGSMVVKASPGPAQAATQAPFDVHPEPYFALGGYKSYYNGNAGDHYTVFDMTNPQADDSYAATLTRGAPQSPQAVNLPTSVSMSFNIRGVGCGKNVYCLNDR